MFSFSQKIILALILSLSPVLSQAKEVVVRGKGREGNPSLSLVKFTGPASIGSTLDTVLKRCNWFRIVDAKANAAYKVSAQYTSGAAVPALSLAITPRGGKTVVIASPALPGEAADQVVYRSVDKLITALFRVPGPCSAPLAFAVGGNNNLKEIYTCRFDGSMVKRLTHNGSISTEPSWGPASKTMVYTAYANNATSVVLVDMRHNRQKHLSHFPGLNAGADLSPDGKWAVLALSLERQIDLYLIPTSGKGRKRITNNLAVESSPCWSPDGGSLCYVSDHEGRPQLYIMPAGGGRAVRLLRDRSEAVSPDWSPASNKVCFSTRVGGQYSIAVVDMNDSSRRRKIITRDAGDWEAPAWSPDGRHLICSRRVGRRRSIYMIDTEDGKTFPITKGGDHSLPSWGN